MAKSPEDERDDEFFNQDYSKEHTGPPTFNTEKSLENNKLKKRSRSSDNAVNPMRNNKNAIQMLCPLTSPV